MWRTQNVTIDNSILDIILHVCIHVLCCYAVVHLAATCTSLMVVLLLCVALFLGKTPLLQVINDLSVNNL